MLDVQFFLLVIVLTFSTYAAYRWLREEQISRRRRRRGRTSEPRPRHRISK